MAWLITHAFRSHTVRMIATFAGGNLVATALGLLASLVQARYVSPEDMGVFRVFYVVAGYLTFLHLGVFDGLQREIPLQLGRGNRTEAERAASACLAWIVLISAVSGALFFCCALVAALRHEWMLFWGWLAFVPVIISSFYGSYLGTTFRTGQQFVKLTQAGLVQSLVGLAVLPLFPLLGYFGACLRTGVTSVAQLLLLHKWRPLKVRPRLHWQGFWAVIRVGLPLSAVGYIWTSLWVSIEGTMVLSWFGTRALGLYSLAVFIRNLGTQLALNMEQVIGVKIYEEYGRSAQARNCLRLALRPTLYGVLASLPLIGVGWLAMHGVVELLMPRYLDATLMMQLMLPMLALTILQLPVTVLWASARLRDNFVSVGAGFLAFVVSAYCLKALRLGPVSVVVGSLFGHVVRLLVAYGFVFRLVSQTARAVPLTESAARQNLTRAV